jgi:hypothetical protein
LREEKCRVENELAQVNRTLDRLKHSLKLRKQDDNNPLTADYTGPGWESQREEGFRSAEEVIDETRYARKNELRERKTLVEQVLGRWKSGQIELPAEDEPDNTKTAEEARTIAIGKWLLKYGNRRNETPNFHDSKENFKEAAGEVIGDDGKRMSKSTVYDALSATGCWDDDPKQGDSSGLDVVLNRTMEYAEEHGDTLGGSQDEE